MKSYIHILALVLVAQSLPAQVVNREQRQGPTARVPQQSRRGAAVQGLVHDEAMNVAVGVRVTLRSLANNNETRQTQSSAEGIFRFSTPSHPEALETCYVALWRLPRPDFHRLVNGALQGTR